MSRNRRRRRRDLATTPAASAPHETPASRPQDDAASVTEHLYENDVERAWDEAPVFQGIDPALMSARQHPAGAAEDESIEAAALHPGLIPFAALMAGPIVAGTLTVFCDGRAPKARGLITTLCLSAAGWFAMQGLVSFGPQRFGPTVLTLASLGLLLAVGVSLLLVYLGPMAGRRASDERTLRQSLLVFLGLSALYWLGRSASWLAWLGR
ncbi:hypothetical protein DL240_00555 [Lujinxingia litoralis]|uniref:Uncharacterized protein n=1 Tax=Lujinxingia litoralis TaxID=2211119 RepID=A0A328CAE3_9DELT|nr:hypothetical protein [Lujinxingia litoralis]RAL24734.1 hypothetical protein DL240_00555 [Lujinxingia litoralis]